MNCLRCGTPVPAGQACPQCGTPAQAPPYPGAPSQGRPPAAPAPEFGYGTPASSYPAFTAPQIATPAGLSMPGAVKEVFSKYATFQGRATPSEYWWWALTLWLALVIPWLGAALISGTTGIELKGSPLAGLLGFYSLIVLLGSAVPSLAVAVRRMHDIGQSGALFLINLVPTIGGIAFLVLCALPSKPFGNQYGLAPAPVR